MVRVNAISVGLVALVGCAKNTLDPEQAAIAWQANSAELGRSATTTPLVGIAADGSFSFDCLEGGTIVGDGAFDATADLTDLSAVASFEYALELVGCARDGVVTDGTLDFTGFASASVAALSAESSFTWVGDLAYTGEVEGDCAIDVTAASSVDLADGASASFEGTLCGDSVSALATLAF